jgi:hypothetical protein
MNRRRILPILALAVIAFLWAIEQGRDAAAQDYNDLIARSKTEFNRRVAAGLPGYERGPLQSPLAAGDQTR